MSSKRAVDKNPWTYDVVVGPMEIAWFGRWRRRLLSDLNGDVLDIGSGTGVNLRYYPHSVDCVTVVDPSSHNISYLKRKAKGRGWGEKGGRCLRSHIGVGEDLPFKSGTFDNVVSTLILCTVQDPAKVISEGTRVLKKGGRFIFLEHQLPRMKPQAFMFNMFSPLWRAPSGCNLNRQTQQEVEGSKCLEKRFEKRFGPVLGYPFYVGIFEKT